jgi:hypothetical protein
MNFIFIIATINESYHVKLIFSWFFPTIPQVTDHYKKYSVLIAQANAPAEN